MIRRLRNFLTVRVAVPATVGTGATAHFCVHPCPEHAALGLLALAASLLFALRERIAS